MDFFHLRDRIWKAGAGNPQGNNTLFLGPEHAAIKDLRTRADVDWLKPDLELMSAEPVIYLGAHCGSDNSLSLALMISFKCSAMLRHGCKARARRLACCQMLTSELCKLLILKERRCAAHEAEQRHLRCERLPINPL